MSSIRQQILYYIRQAARNVLAVVEQSPGRIESRQHDIQEEIGRLKAELRQTTPANPALLGYKVFSQADEDGIIQALLSKLPASQLSRTAIEIGCGDGRENNTHFLLLCGFRVCWLDGSPANIAAIRRELGMETDRKGPLMVTESFVTLDNITGLIADHCAFLDTNEPDFFSLDIDGNDLQILARAMDGFAPKIICVEYNAKFPPPATLSIRYNATHKWALDDYQGASLQAFCDLLAGYTLVACNLSGVNAFFVRNDFRDLFPSYPVAALFQPFRSHLRLLSSGHPPSLKWARDVLLG
jgi:hypothetical protein